MTLRCRPIAIIVTEASVPGAVSASRRNPLDIFTIKNVVPCSAISITQIYVRFKTNNVRKLRHFSK